MQNEEVFKKDPPEIAMAHSSIEISNDGVAHALPLELSHPIKKGSASWEFCTTFSQQGRYHDVVLFIDWLPSAVRPKPIQLLFPESEA